jgi:hypothetical protein
MSVTYEIRCPDGTYPVTLLREHAEARPALGLSRRVRVESATMISFFWGGNLTRRSTPHFQAKCPRQESNLDLPLRRFGSRRR